MDNLFTYVDKIDAEKYTDYFYNVFLTKYEFFQHLEKRELERIKNPEYVSKFRFIKYIPSEVNDPIVNELESFLIEKFKFPKFSHFFIFLHEEPQPIHADAVKPWKPPDTPTVSLTALNLPLKGYNGTGINWYTSKNGEELKSYMTHKGMYFDKEDDLVPITTLPGSNRWILINTEVPHNVVNINSADPRFTLTFRFENNPSYLHLKELLDKYS
jgi:hypothetical protein